METTCKLIVIAAGAAFTAAAFAAPAPTKGNRPADKGPVFTGVSEQPGSGTRGAPFMDNFDSYANGAAISTVGNGWELWPAGAEGFIDNTQSFSPSNSLRIGVGADVVQQFSVDDGQWEFKAMTYVPSTSTGDGYIILLNQYDGGGSGTNWSLQVRFGASDLVVQSDFSAETLPLITNQWVEFRAEIDLDTDTLNEYYGGMLLATSQWSTNVSGGGITSIAALDLFSLSINAMFFDNVMLSELESCAVDLNGDGAVTIADFLEFLNLFSAGDARAEFDGNPGITVGDFLAFLNAFAVGCP